MEIAIIIPTYNEKENISELIPKIFSLNISNLSVVIVDDNSPDGTGETAEEMKKNFSNLHVIHGNSKTGLGKAYLTGFRYALENGAECIFEMDADFSHDFQMIPVFLENIEKHDLVSGSRYIPEGKIENWNFARRLVSKLGNVYARTVLGVPIRDLTTGYKCYRRNVAEKFLSLDIDSIGYVFQIETSYIAFKSGFSVKEIPIVFTERRIGKSKFNSKIFWESFWKVIRLRMKKIFNKNRKKLNWKYFDQAAYLLAILFAVYFTFLSVGRHESLKSYLNDLGTYDQVVWNSAQGDFFDNSSNMLNVRNYSGAHFSPILMFFIPFYWIHPSPFWLLFFQSLAVGGGAVFIYLFAKEKLKNCLLALVFFASYLFNPFVHNGLLYDFHEVVFAIFFASGAFYFLEKEKWKLFLLFAALLSLCQEHLALLVFMMGLYMVFFKKKRKLGILSSLLSLFYFFAVMTVFIPHFSLTGNPALLSNSSPYPSRYAWLGGNFFEVIKNIISNPAGILQVMLSAERIKFMTMMVAPVFSLGIYSWPIAIVFPLLAINLLSGNSMTYSVVFYHNAILVPFVYFSAIVTFRKWFLGSAFYERMFVAFVLAFSLGSFYLFSLAPASRNSKISDYLPSEHAKKIKEIKKIIPCGSVLSVQHNLGPHFSQNKEIYRFPVKEDEADFIILDRADPYADDKQNIFRFDYALQMTLPEWKEEIEKIEKSPEFEIFYDDGKYLIFKHKKYAMP